METEKNPGYFSKAKDFTETSINSVISSINGLFPFKKIEDSNSCNNISILVLYGTETGKTEKLCQQLMEKCNNQQINCELMQLNQKCADDFTSIIRDSGQGKKYFSIVFVIPTEYEGKPPSNAKDFYQHILDCSQDFRVGNAYMKGSNIAVYGVGNSVYSKTYNTVGIQLYKNLRKLGGSMLLGPGLGDENSEEGIIEHFYKWCDTLIKRIIYVFRTPIAITAPVQEETITHQDDNGNYESDAESTNLDLDIEDLAVYENGISNTDSEKEMVTPMIRKSLTKQGYKIVGSHSGVKLCRWTKAMVRGRGGCYKHSFYGIASHRCMEATPSLACANKCVFCWRHHTNPVGTSWTWKLDPPKFILDNLMENHRKMVKQLKGIQGADPDRILEASTIKHCALSLVGEPIMYPYINELIDLLHQHNISTFLVTNAQFPDAIKNLPPITQLYVSIDAGTKDSLKKIDRPLFSNFWERYISSIDYLSGKQQRTVFRLTLVRDWNLSDVEDYAKLVERGKPSFIEIKAVTYCGQDEKDQLRITNVPYHEEVIKFSNQLLDFLEDYDISCEHEHSNCILLAHRKFLINDEWHTWIDYDRFQQLYKIWKDSNGEKTFTDTDYSVKTPPWAVFGSPEHGFDPSDIRFRRKKTLAS